MITVTQQQALTRWDTLPDSVREALVAPINTDFIVKAARDQHLPEEKMQLVSHAVALVLFGFLHAEELAKEIKERASVDIKIAEEIAKTIDFRILRPLKGELGKVYAAPLPEHEGAAGGTRLVTEIQKPVPSAPAPLPVQLEAIGAAKAPPPRVIPGPVILNKEAKQTPAPKPPEAPAKPGPILIHEEQGAKPIAVIPARAVPPADQKIREAKFARPEPPKPAQIEIGRRPPPSPIVPPRPSPQPPFSPPVPSKPETFFVPKPPQGAPPPPAKDMKSYAQEGTQPMPSPAAPSSGAMPGLPPKKPEELLSRVVHYNEQKTLLGPPKSNASTPPSPSLPQRTAPSSFPLPASPKPLTPSAPIEARPITPPPPGPPVPPALTAEKEMPRAKRAIPPPPAPPRPPIAPSHVSFTPRGATPLTPQKSAPDADEGPHGEQEYIDTVLLKKIKK